MTPVSFTCDYCEGAHPKILQRLLDTNMIQASGYGEDPFCFSARAKIREATCCPKADLFFLVGGTQTNATVIDSMLRGYEGVIAAASGHIAVHESGAIEFGGHKVITLPAKEGKLEAVTIEDYLRVFHADEAKDHMVLPGMVYISFPTELGTLYTAQELEDIYRICRQYDLPLFIDGARMGYGLAASADITLPWLCRHCDAFYIGGTKVGALCGEAVVFTHNNAPRQFFSIIKQHGALLAKGRLTGVQFDALFTDNLYFDISRHAIDMARQMKKMMADKGYRFYIDSPTNQQFFIIGNDKVKELEQRVQFTHWGPYDADHTICRFVTSWATTEDDLNTLQAIV